MFSHKVRFYYTICIIFLLHVLGISLVYSESCMNKLKNVNDFINASANCMTELNINPQEVPSSSVKLVENKYEDNCHSKCVMAKMKFISGSTINKEEILEVIKENAPADIQSHLKEIINKCADSTERLSKLGKKDTDDPEKESCKYFAMFHHCFNEQEQKIC